MDTVKTSEEINHDRRRLLAGATKGQGEAGGTKMNTLSKYKLWSRFARLERSLRS
jgi:hypothetical protein